MKLGLLTDSLSDLGRDEALDYAAGCGLSTVEIGLGGAYGGWSPAPHADLGALKDSAAARQELLNAVDERGLRLEAFNAAGNPLHPVHSRRDDHVLRTAIRLAEELGVGTVVTMSGLPGAPGDSFPAWVTTVWPPENLELLRHQWDVALKYWDSLAAEATQRGVRLAVELHANQLVYSVPGFQRLREEVGDVVGANLDPSHLMWMGADPIAVIREPTGSIYHVHAKDTRIEPAVAVRSRLETVPNEQYETRAWNYVAVGRGHPDGVDFWRAFIDGLRREGYYGVVSIENEDHALGQGESVDLAVSTLTSALGTTERQGSNGGSKEI